MADAPESRLLIDGKLTDAQSGKTFANINPANVASIALFTGLGARHIQNTYEL